VQFRRTDLPGTPEIPATVDFVGQETLLRQTVLRISDTPEACVQTVEHVLAVLQALEIDNALIEMTGPEAPIWDGSAAEIAARVFDAGVVEIAGSQRKFYHIPGPMAFFPEKSEGVEYTAWPSEHLTVTYFLKYDHPAIGSQACSLMVTPDDFVREIAPARTFCMIEEVEYLRSKGLIKGGSVENAVVFGPSGPLNTDLRWDNEPARHKALDLLGDLMLLGHPLRGHILVTRGGHQTNAQFVRHLRKELTPS